MNSKKAKQLRAYCRENNAYSEEPKYKQVIHKKIQYIETANGIQAVTVQKIQLINESKYTYRKIKKAYNKGEVII